MGFKFVLGRILVNDHNFSDTLYKGPQLLTMHPVHGHRVMNRFRECRVSATFSHFDRTRDLHILEFILLRTFVFGMQAHLRNARSEF